MSNTCTHVHTHSHTPRAEPEDTRVLINSSRPVVASSLCSFSALLRLRWLTASLTSGSRSAQGVIPPPLATFLHPFRSSFLPFLLHWHFSLKKSLLSLITRDFSLHHVFSSLWFSFFFLLSSYFSPKSTNYSHSGVKGLKVKVRSVTLQGNASWVAVLNTFLTSYLSVGLVDVCGCDRLWQIPCSNTLCAAI